jgi:hypothetical protein
MATRGGAIAKVGVRNSNVRDLPVRYRTMGYMDKLIYRLIVGLACLILAIVLIVAPIVTRMFIDMDRREKRIIQAEKRIQKKIEQIEQPELPKGN